mgnify:CR=1 FL=1
MAGDEKARNMSRRLRSNLDPNVRVFLEWHRADTFYLDPFEGRCVLLPKHE